MSRRAIRAAKQEGAAGVEVRPDGTIRVLMGAPEGAIQGASDKGLDREGEIII